MISSGKNLTTENCVSLTVYVLFDQETDEFVSTFQLEIPEDGVDISQYHSLVDGIEFAAFKMNKLLDVIELDESDEDDD